MTLWVPKLIRQHCDRWLAVNKPGATLGGLYIQIVAKWAWDHGFTCEHEGKLIIAEPPPKKKYRCKDCGMLLSEPRLMKDGTRKREELGYSLLGDVR